MSSFLIPYTIMIYFQHYQTTIYVVSIHHSISTLIIFNFQFHQLITIFYYILIIFQLSFCGQPTQTLTISSTKYSTFPYFFLPQANEKFRKLKKCDMIIKTLKTIKGRIRFTVLEKIILYPSVKIWDVFILW